MMTIRHCTLMAAAVAVPSALATADYQDWCGWTELASRIGIENVPTGLDVIVGQVEAPDSSSRYMPDSNDSDFDGKYLISRSGGPTSPSSHATNVARKFYGLSNSLAPGVWFINCYEVINWLQVCALVNLVKTILLLKTPTVLVLISYIWPRTCSK